MWYNVYSFTRIVRSYTVVPSLPIYIGSAASVPAMGSNTSADTRLDNMLETASPLLYTPTLRSSPACPQYFILVARSGQISILVTTSNFSSLPSVPSAAPLPTPFVSTQSEPYWPSFVLSKPSVLRSSLTSCSCSTCSTSLCSLLSIYVAFVLPLSLPPLKRSKLFESLTVTPKSVLQSSLVALENFPPPVLAATASLSHFRSFSFVANISQRILSPLLDRAELSDRNVVTNSIHVFSVLSFTSR